MAELADASDSKSLEASPLVGSTPSAGTLFMTHPGFTDLDSFWPFYIAQHMNRTNRRLHFYGTNLGLVFLSMALAYRRPLLLAPALLLGYGLAWVGHYAVEKNRPATFQYPLLSFRADLRMWRLMWTGGMEAEIIRLKQDILRYR